MSQFSLAKLFGMTVRESANDGSDFTNPDADYRRLFLGEDGALHLKDSAGAVTDVGGGGAVTHAYAGYNTIGGSTENMTPQRMYMKKFTLASDALVVSIGVHLRWGAQDIGHIGSALMEDSTGVPKKVLGFSGNVGLAADLVLQEATSTWVARWLHMPIGVWCVAGDYWAGVMSIENTTANPVIYYDTSGSDPYYDSGGNFIVDGTNYTNTNSTKKYSIRASTLS